jgi:methylmalonyl-CoA/ethylmalonyl-CoA epimerase
VLRVRAAVIFGFRSRTATLEQILEHPLDHVAIAVPSIAAVLPAFESISGATGSPTEHVAAQGVNVVFVGTGPACVELIEPAGTDSPITKFLERRGAGLHHIAYRVPDLVATLAELEARGIELIDRSPRPGARGHSVAFLHPRSTHGVLVELVQKESVSAG